MQTEPEVPLALPRMVTVAGHFGELLQGRLGPDGPVALVTLPCPGLIVRALPGPQGQGLLQAGVQVLSPQVLSRFLPALGEYFFPDVTLHWDMPPGGGAGASTAGLVAVAHALGVTDADRVARACLQAEGASDPLMFEAPETLLWASRQGRVLDRLAPMPPMVVLGGFSDAAQVTDPADHRFPDMSDLVAAWKAGAGNLARLAGLAAESARRTLALRGPARDATEALMRRTGALGMVIAHTGSARGLIFAPGQVPDGAAGMLRDAGWTQVFQFRAGAVA